MKKTLLAMIAACLSATGMATQTNESIQIRVINIPSATGKILLLTDKGQYGIRMPKKRKQSLKSKNFL